MKAVARNGLAWQNSASERLLDGAPAAAAADADEMATAPFGTVTPETSLKRIKLPRRVL